MTTTHVLYGTQPEVQAPPNHVAPKPVSLDVTDLYRTLLVEPGTKITLGSVDPGYCGENISHEWTLPALQAEAEKENLSFPVVPVLLAGAEVTSGFLFLNTWVDLRNTLPESEAIERLIAGMRGAPKIRMTTEEIMKLTRGWR